MDRDRDYEAADTSPQRESQMSNVVGSMAFITEELIANSKRLEERLGLVLRTGLASPSEPETKEEQLVPLANKLRADYRRLAAVNDRITSIIERLEV